VLFCIAASHFLASHLKNQTKNESKSQCLGLGHPEGFGILKPNDLEPGNIQNCQSLGILPKTAKALASGKYRKNYKHQAKIHRRFP